MLFRGSCVRLAKPFFLVLKNLPAEDIGNYLLDIPLLSKNLTNTG